MTDFRTTTIVAEVWSVMTPAYQATEVVAEVWSVMTPAMQMSDFLIEMWALNVTVGTQFVVSLMDIEVWSLIQHNTAPFFFVIT
ncbi:MAG TPA: hypothetical protein VM659_28915 [Dongiaceae bacterium]|nr:hypothetical protein [Dongiaceae bacterium]